MSKKSIILSAFVAMAFATAAPLQTQADDFKFKLGEPSEVNPVSLFYEQEQQYREFKRERLISGYEEKVAADAAFLEGCEALIKNESEDVDKLAEFARLKDERKARCDSIDEDYKAAIAAWKEVYKERREQEYRAYEFCLSAYIDVRSPREIEPDTEKEEIEQESAAVEVQPVTLTRARESGLVYVPGSVGDDAKMHLRGNLKKCARFIVSEVDSEEETGVAFEIEMTSVKKGKKRPHISLDPVAVFKYSDEYIEQRLTEELAKLK